MGWVLRGCSLRLHGGPAAAGDGGLSRPLPPLSCDFGLLYSLVISLPFALILFCQQVRWITFHSGYDFGYLLKLLTCSSLPANEAEFFQLLKASFCSVFGS